MKNTFMEEWRDVGIIDGIDFTGLYQVSNLGNVKSLNYRNTDREEILTPFMNTWGYLQVDLCKNGKRKHPRINRLEAIAFIPIPDHLKHIPIEELDVEHIDGNKENNRLDNLRWNTHKGNCRNQLTRQHYSEVHKGKHLTEETRRKISETMTNGKKSKRVLQLDKDTLEVIREWPSAREVHRQLGYSQGNISQCCKGKFEQRYGYKWQYA